jgi:CBS domain-containing protein
MTVRAIISGRGDVTSVSPDTVVTDVVALLATHRIGAVPVTDGSGAVVGIFSERDVIYGLQREGAAMLARKIGDVMTSPALTVEVDTPAISALSMMSRRRIRHLPVVDGAKMVGFVSIGDLVKYRIDKIESEAAAMREYIAG